MEHWLAQLEMDMEPNVSTIVDFPFQQYQQSGTMESCYDRQLAAALGEDFPYPLLAEGEISFPQWEFDYNVMEQFTSAPNVSNDSGNYNVNIINNNNNNDHDRIHSENNIVMSSNNVEGISQQLQHREETMKQAGSGGVKRVRHPRQVQEHIVAERKRRESLSRMFISLSTIVPGLTKMDKTSVLGEAIKYVKQLQEKVKVLEEAAARRTVESIVVVKKSQLIVDDNDGGGDNDSSSTVDDHSPSGSGSHEADNLYDSLPEIQVKISGKSLLLRIYSEEQKDILAKLLAVVDKHGMSVTTCNATPFDNIALDISIIAKMMERGFSFDVKDFIRSLRCALRG